MHIIYEFLIELGWSATLAWWIDFALLSLILLTVAWLLRLFSRFILVGIFHRISGSTKTTIDDTLIENKFPKNLSRFVPYFFLSALVGFWANGNANIEDWLSALIDVYAVFVAILTIRSLLRTLKQELQNRPQFKDKPIKSYIQVVMIFLWGIGLLLTFSILSGKDLVYFFTGLGALSAVILLVFKDTILGFVASIQIAANDLVRIGDWITMESYGADGTVIEINLSTIKVQNFDNTITTVPTYKLLSSSIKNWRGMSESEGRRIKRPLYIRASSVRFMSDVELREITQLERFKTFVEEKKADVSAYNKAIKTNTSIPLNGRNLTNIGLFRSYIETYLEQHPSINKSLTVMCRQLAPTPNGIPLEVYAFTSDKEWKNHETISADIFDHILASASFFHLKLFEFEQQGIS
ncbi:MAG: Miniconductance mechanosensitive channel YbdG [Flavobacteriales bacterium]|jgi:miniconductance mechanosensitive channel|nr:MAG: mechanosensitive ion channel family protein [Flavobacteriales bacterium]CAI8285880.1 MAG: Miniconductance mechanosensitive channel YbdG [Flavobacteriales bacterium]|tara:strand:- start:88 stop:1314 length:1227 start_codon:yes stop_codon:yes gene_type:complete